MGKVSIDIFQNGINVANKRSGVMAQWLKAWAALLEDLGLITSTFMADHNHL